MRGDYSRPDPLDARFRSAIGKRDAKKTGLKKTDEVFYRCSRETCYGVVRTHRDPGPCPHPHPNVLLEKLCGAPMVRCTVVEIEAMPIGRVIIDMRRRGW